MTQVRFFAAAEEAVGAEQLIRADSTLGDLRRALALEYPPLAGILPRCAVLVGGARVDDDYALQNEDIVDVLPPFAGG